MSSNFLFLNPSKTEFLIFGLPQQLSKLNNPTIHLLNNMILSPVDSARILVSSLRNISLIFSISKSCFLNIRDLRRIRYTNDQTTACTITILLWFIHSFIHSLLLNLPATQTNRLQLSLTLLLVLSPKLLNFITLYSYSYISPLAQNKWENQIQGSLSHI